MMNNKNLFFTWLAYFSSDYILPYYLKITKKKKEIEEENKKNQNKKRGKRKKRITKLKSAFQNTK